MKNFTQKALFVVLTVFVLVGLFYGLATPVKVSQSLNVSAADGAPVCLPGSPDGCPGTDEPTPHPGVR